MENNEVVHIKVTYKGESGLYSATADNWLNTEDKWMAKRLRAMIESQIELSKLNKHKNEKNLRD